MAKHGSNWQGVKIQNEKMNTEDKQAERHVDGQTKGQRQANGQRCHYLVPAYSESGETQLPITMSCIAGFGLKAEIQNAKGISE